MQGINQALYQTNPFYRDLVDRMIKNEQEAERLRQQRNEVQASLYARQMRLDAEAAYRQQRLLGYVNQLPYQQMTPICAMQWSAPYLAYQNNFVDYWSSPKQPPKQPAISAQEQEELRRAFHSALDCAAELSKEEAPVPSIIFDGLGVLTAGNLFELAKSVVSLIDTAKRL